MEEWEKPTDKVARQRQATVLRKHLVENCEQALLHNL